MTNEGIIKLRDTLKAGENLPLRIFVNNAQTIIDESLPTQFVKWDDKNGILHVFRLVGMQEDKLPNNLGQAISVYSMFYEYIEGMEVVRLPLNTISKFINSLRKNGCVFSTDFEKRIIDTFESILDVDRWRMSPSDLNDAVSSVRHEGAVDAVNEKDDYYEDGRMTEPFKETVAVNRYNESISGVKKS